MKKEAFRFLVTFLDFLGGMKHLPSHILDVGGSTGLYIDFKIKISYSSQGLVVDNVGIFWVAKMIPSLHMYVRLPPQYK